MTLATTSTPSWYSNPDAKNWTCPQPNQAVAIFHKSMRSYAPTPLVEIPLIAQALGVSRVFVKDESQRMGLGAFKILGASWAIAQALTNGTSPKSLQQVQDTIQGSPHLVAATDGNHGRAVAHMGRLLGLSSTIFTPYGVTQQAIDNIAAEGAQVIAVAGDYDQAVDEARRFSQAHANAVHIQDMSWPGYKEIPQWIIEGYTTLCAEVDEQLSELQLAADLIAVPVGVGSLLEAVTVHYRSGASTTPTILSVEPESAACVLRSLHNGALTSVKTETTIMAGMNCGTPSSDSWPIHQAGVDAAVCVRDEDARIAMAKMAASGLDSGPCGSATLAGVQALTADLNFRQAVTLSNNSVVVLLSTESTSANPAQ